jgi:hypothetical protein
MSQRAENDPLGYLIWGLSRTVIYEKGSHKGQTNWSQIEKLLELFKKKYPVAKKVLDMSSKNRKDSRNNFEKKYPKLKKPTWEFAEKRQRAAKNLVKLITGKPNSK